MTKIDLTRVLDILEERWPLQLEIATLQAALEAERQQNIQEEPDLDEPVVE